MPENIAQAFSNLDAASSNRALSSLKGPWMSKSYYEVLMETRQPNNKKLKKAYSKSPYPALCFNKEQNNTYKIFYSDLHDSGDKPFLYLNKINENEYQICTYADITDTAQTIKIIDGLTIHWKWTCSYSENTTRIDEEYIRLPITDSSDYINSIYHFFFNTCLAGYYIDQNGEKINFYDSDSLVFGDSIYTCRVILGGYWDDDMSIVHIENVKSMNRSFFYFEWKEAKLYLYEMKDGKKQKRKTYILKSLGATK